jgi:hypothetical protein
MASMITTRRFVCWKKSNSLILLKGAAWRHLGVVVKQSLQNCEALHTSYNSVDRAAAVAKQAGNAGF